MSNAEHMAKLSCFYICLILGTLYGIVSPNKYKILKGDVMAVARFILFITGLVWTLYGLWLVWDPVNLQYAGFTMEHWSTKVEVFAMYGLVEFWIGVYAFMGVFKPEQHLRSALLVWTGIFTCLALGRIIGIHLYDGDWWVYDFGAAGLPNSYNPGGLWFYEFPSMILCWIATYQLRGNDSV